MSDTLGKVDRNLIDTFIGAQTGAHRAEVQAGPRFGVDVSVVHLPGGQAMALTSDPLSLIPSLGLEESAWLSVHLMANDMATTGFAPQYGQFVLNLPAGLSEQDFRTYWEHIHRFCADIGTAITGGHTGFIEGQNSTLAGGGTFVTVAPQADLLTSQGAQPGDAILVTKSAAQSSASILAMSFPKTVKNRLGLEVYQRAHDSFYHTTALPDALAAVEERQQITAMHDVTEGGVLGAIYELATAAGVGARIQNERLPVGEVQRAICSLFSLDPRHIIGAGSMIITCPPQHAEAVAGRLRGRDIPCVRVGELVDQKAGITLVQQGAPQPLVYQEEDPYWKAFFRALKEGWT